MVYVGINDPVLSKTLFIKYLGVLFDSNLFWIHQGFHVTALCSQRIDLFKRVLFYLPNNVRTLLYNAFARSCHSYC